MASLFPGGQDTWTTKTDNVDTVYAADVNNLQLAVASLETGGVSTQNIAYAAAITPNVSSGEYVIVGTLTGNITINAPTNPATGRQLTLRFTQDGTGNRTVTWNAVLKVTNWAINPAANAVTEATLTYDGTNWYLAAGPPSLKGSLAWSNPIADYGATGNGVADDTTAVQSAIADGFCILPSGKSFAVSQLTVPSGTIFNADGATIKQIAASNKSLLKFNVVAHVGTRIQGGIWDGNGTNQTGANTVIDAGLATSYDNLSLDRLTVLNPSGHGIYVSEVTHNNKFKSVTRCKVVDHGIQALAFGIYADYVGSIDIDGNWVLTTRGYDCIELGHSGIANLAADGHMRARGNVTVTSGGTGPSGINFPFSDHAEIADNTCIGGIINNDTNTANYVQIIGNKVLSAIPAAGYAGIRGAGSQYVVTGNVVMVSQNNGIAGTAMKSWAVNANYIYSSQAATQSGHAIDDGGTTATTSTFTGNILDGVNGKGFLRAFRTQGGHHVATSNIVVNGGCFNGIANTSGLNNTFALNDLAVFNSAVENAGDSTSHFWMNRNYNPVGVVTPAVPASTVAVAAVGYDRSFYVTTGAGATTIAIQGGPTITLQASVAGQYVRVPAGQTMTPTYANPPTWVVEGE